MADSKRVCITVDAETLRLAEREARRLKISRNDFIRMAVRVEVKSAAREEEDVRENQSQHHRGFPDTSAR